MTNIHSETTTNEQDTQEKEEKKKKHIHTTNNSKEQLLAASVRVANTQQSVRQTERYFSIRTYKKKYSNIFSNLKNERKEGKKKKIKVKFIYHTKQVGPQRHQQSTSSVVKINRN